MKTQVLMEADSQELNRFLPTLSFLRNNPVVSSMTPKLTGWLFGDKGDPPPGSL
jgi:hypothetical protein